MRGKSVTALRTSASARFRRRSSSRAWASSRGRSISMSCQDSARVRRSSTLTDCRRPRASRCTLSTGCTMRCTRDVHLAENDAEGLDQERHVRRDHAHDGAMRGRGVCGRERRREFEQHAAALAHPAEFEVRQCRGGEVGRAMQAQILFRDAAEEGPQEVARQAACCLRDVPFGAADYLLDQREAGGGNLAEHAVTLWKGEAAGRGIIHRRSRRLIRRAPARFPRRGPAIRAPAGRAWPGRAA